MAGIGSMIEKKSERLEDKSREIEAVLHENTLVRRYGPLMKLADLATMLDRSPDGLRVTLRSNGEWVNKINAARLQLGRRVYFRTAEIAELLGIR